MLFTRKWPVFGLIGLLIISLAVSCEKEEGEGGTSTIMGRVYAIDFNDEWTIKRGEYYAPGIDVYIIYGEDSIYSDDFETGMGGWYRFEHLTPGSYRVYAFSRDSTRRSASDEVPVIKEVKLKKDETVIVDDIRIYE